MLPSADVLGEVDIIKVLNYRPTNSHEWLKTFPIFNDGTFVQVSIQIPQGSAATIWGEVVLLLLPQFISECSSESMIKIGLYCQTYHKN